MSYDIDNAIRRALDREPDRADVERVIGRLHRIPANRVERRGRTRATRVAILAACTVATVGVAYGAPRAVTYLFQQDDAVERQIDQFQRADAPRVTQKEYNDLVAGTMVPDTKRLGKLRDDEMRALFQLAPIQKSRVIVDDPTVGRLVAVPIVGGGEGLCYLVQSPTNQIGTGMRTGGCTGTGLPASGIVPSFSATSNDGVRVRAVGGFAADDVERIDIVETSGKTQRVALIENAFYWEGRADADKPASIRITRRGKQISEPWPIVP